MAKLAIKGHATRGEEVIKILEMLGGENPYAISTTVKGLLYTISIYDNRIISCSPTDKFVFFTLEEFLEKFPYKVGDKVLAYYEGIFAQFTIQDMRWNYELNRVEYKICSSWCDTSLMQPYKEETMEEKLMPKIDFNGYCKDKYLLDLGNYELKEENGKTYAVRKRPECPKTYGECCGVLGMDSTINHVVGTHFRYRDIIMSFIKLLICRDAYWKIAGKKMGLGKSWEPEWKNPSERKYCIVNTGGNITKWVQQTTNKILAFPTEEMSDVFYENFKELIEECKELL